MNKDKSKITFNWVLINQIAIGSGPSNVDDLALLSNFGIKSILSLCSSDEVCLPVISSNFFNHERYILPDHKSGKLVKAFEIDEALIVLESLLKLGPVFVHCFAGIERSPLICIAWLISRHNISIKDALSYLMQVHNRTNPLPSQINILKQISTR